MKYAIVAIFYSACAVPWHHNCLASDVWFEDMSLQVCQKSVEAVRILNQNQDYKFKCIEQPRKLP